MKETGSGELSKLYKSNYQKFCKVLIQYICRGGDDRQFAFDTINELMTKKQENEFKIQLREYEKNHARKPSALESLIADLRRGKTATEVDTAINYVEVVKDKDIKWLKANVWPKVDKKTMKILLRNLLYLEKNAAQTAKNPFHPSNTIQYSYKPRVRSMKDITHVGTCKDFRETLPFREEDLNGCIHQLMFYLRDADGVWRNDSK